MRKKDTWIHRWIEKVFMVDLRRDCTFYVPEPLISGTSQRKIQNNGRTLSPWTTFYPFHQSTLFCELRATQLWIFLEDVSTSSMMRSSNSSAWIHYPPTIPSFYFRYQSFSSTISSSVEAPTPFWSIWPGKKTDPPVSALPSWPD